MGFWDGEPCDQCGEPLVERFVTMHRKVDNGYVLIEHVPAGVCVSCGARYYAANVLKTIEATIHGRRAPVREVLVPVYALEDAEN